MVSRSMLVARAGILARLMSVTYARGLIRLLNSTKTRPIAATGRAALELGIPGVHTRGAIFRPAGWKYGRNAFGNFSYKPKGVALVSWFDS